MSNKEFLKRKAAELNKLIQAAQPKTRTDLCTIVAPHCQNFAIKTVLYYGSIQGVRVTIKEDKNSLTIPKRGEVYSVFQ